MLIQLSKGCRNNVSTLGRKDFGIPFKGWMNCWFDRDINIHSIHCFSNMKKRTKENNEVILLPENRVNLFFFVFANSHGNMLLTKCYCCEIQFLLPGLLGFICKVRFIISRKERWWLCWSMLTSTPKIPSEMEVAPRYNFWNSWHCWHCWPCWPCWHCWHCWQWWHCLHCLHCLYCLHCLL